MAKTNGPAKPAPAKKAAASSAAGTPAKKSAAKKVAAPTKAAAPSGGTHKASAAAAKKVSRAHKTASSPFPARWLVSQEQALLEERATYTRQAESLQAEADALVADFESGDSQFDEDGGEGDTLSSERERDLTLSAQARAAIEEIDHALTKFALGTYGVCEASGDLIPVERLEAIPWARVQVQYKTGGLGRR